jgi:hypothetical protein
MTQPRMPKTAPPLSRRLETAFARLDPATPVPPWPRSVRIGVDYSLRVTGMNPATDRDADSLAYACFVLGNLAECDPPGAIPVPVRTAAGDRQPPSARQTGLPQGCNGGVRCGQASPDVFTENRRSCAHKNAPAGPVST